MNQPSLPKPCPVPAQTPKFSTELMKLFAHLVTLR